MKTFAFILTSIRLPRTVLVLLTGAALGGSGAAYQGLFRNPLADPYLIGVASGAGLGAVLAMSVQWPYSFWGLLAVPAAAFVGALLTVFLVYALARVGKTVPTTNLILAGVAFGSFATALTSFLMLRSTGELRRAIAWLLGGASQAGWEPVLAILPFLAIGLGVLLLSGHALNLLQFGDDQAQQMGLPVTRAADPDPAGRFPGYRGGRVLFRDHRFHRADRPARDAAVVRRGLPPPAAALAHRRCRRAAAGGCACARSVLAPQELPVGIVTALVGAPFFLWVLRRAKNQGYW